MFLYRKRIYKPLHGKRTLENTCSTIRLSILTPSHVTFMKNTHRDQILLLSLAPFFVTQAMVKTGKLALLLTHLLYNLQIVQRMVQVETLRPLQTYVIKTFSNKHLNRTRTVKLYMNLCNIHPRGSVTPLHRLRSMILLSKLFLKTDRIILEAVETTNALILMQIKKVQSLMCARTFFGSFGVQFSLSIFILLFIFAAQTHHSTFFML